MGDEANQASGGGQLTDEHHSWMESFFGVSTRPKDEAAPASGQAAAPGGSAPPPKEESSGGFFGALSDAASAVGNAASTVVHGAVDATEKVVSVATDVVGKVAETAIDVSAKVEQAVVDVVPLPDSVKGAAKTAIDFQKGVAEGAVEGVTGLVKGVAHLAGSVAKEGYDLATSEKAREEAGATIVHGAEAVGGFVATAVTDPSKAGEQIEGAVKGAADKVVQIGKSVYHSYEEAEKAGHGAEWIGKGVGQVGVMVAGAVLTDGASLAGEGAAVAGEGMVLATEGVEVLEGGAALARGAEVVEDTAALAKGAGAVEDTAALAKGAGAVEDTSALATKGAGAVEDSTAAAQGTETAEQGGQAVRGATSTGEDLVESNGVSSEVQEEFDQLMVDDRGMPPVDDAAPAPDLDEPGLDQSLDRGHDPTWEKDAKTRLPKAEKGEWVEGNAGDGRWKPHDPTKYGLEDGQTIRYSEGTPDLAEHATQTPAGESGSISVDGMTGDAEADREAAIQAIAERDNTDPATVKAWLQENKLQLHHAGGDEMQIISDSIHAAPHGGGAAELRAADNARQMAADAADELQKLRQSNPEVDKLLQEFDQAEAQRAADLFEEARPLDGGASGTEGVAGDAEALEPAQGGVRIADDVAGETESVEPTQGRVRVVDDAARDAQALEEAEAEQAEIEAAEAAAKRRRVIRR